MLGSLDFYTLVCGNKFKKISETIQDGQGGMYYVLKILSESACELTAGEISERFQVSTARTAVMLSTLEKKGYIEKAKAKDDGRKTIVKITPLGENTLKDRMYRILCVFDEYLEKLDMLEREELYNLLNKLLEK